jgi:hypothetical protein
MLVKTIFSSFSLVLLGCASANAAPTLIKQYDAWGAYSYRSDSGTICYVVSVPTTRSPANVDHGDNYFIVSRTPTGEEPEALMGYVLRSGSKIRVTIGDRSFSMFSDGDKGWVENASDEPAMTEAMRGGSDMILSAVSQRGTATRYTYSLSGITAALKRIALCK